jgi:predicted DNA binding protein
MREVVLKVTMPDNWVKDICKKYPAPIKFIECMPYGKSGGRGLIEIKGDNTDKIVAEIKKHPDVCKIDVSHLKNGVLGSVVTVRCAACRALTGSDCFLISASSFEDGSVEWKLITGAEGSLSDLIENLEKNGCRVELMSAVHLSKKSLLTRRQEEIIRAAFEKGYYDYPKRITINELAKMFDISSSTLGEIIQRGEKKIILEHFRPIYARHKLG